MKIFVAIFCILISSGAFAVDVEERRQKIIKIINEELREVDRLDQQARGKDPDLLLRIAELNLEKARLYREKENKDFLAIPSKKRARINKKNFFKQSSRYYGAANTVSLKIIKKYKRYKRLGEVYYILGFNAKEANKTKTASKYLSLATKKTRDPKTKVKSQISLAEVYYNQKKYRKAIPLYENALAKHKDKWWTKDAFNLAWCYHRVNRHNKAVSKMEEVYKKSKDSKYIDMSAPIERDIGLFYATAGSIQRGVNFYKKVGINFTEQLVKIGMSLQEQGQFSRAEKAFGQALRNEKSEKRRVFVQIEQLGLFQKYGKYSKHAETSKDLFISSRKNLLDDAQMTTFKFQLGKVGAVLQKQVVSKTYRRLAKIRKAKANQAITYFGYLSLLDSNKSDEYRYLQAETSFAIRQNREAYKYYKDTFEYSEKNKRSKFKMRAMEGMLAVLSLNKKPNYKDNIFVFEAYLRSWPSNKKSKDIYQRLFKNYLETGNYNKAKGTLDRYVKAYPKDKTQEVMIANLMDIDRKKGRNDSIRAWITAIDAGKYRVSSKYKIKLQELLTTMQIEDVQKSLNKGNKRVALIGYHEILKDTYSTKRSKINAKYNLAALYYELGDSDKAYQWSLSAMDEMNSSDIKKFSASFITISNFLFTSLKFEKSAALATIFVRKLCRTKYKKKNIAFKNAAFTYLSDKKIKETERLLKIGKECRIPKSLISEVEYELMREYYTARNWNKYEFYAYSLKDNSRYYNKVIDDFINLSNLHQKFNNNKKSSALKKVAWKNYYRAKKSRASISFESLDYFAESYLSKMNETVRRINAIKFSFPESIFAKKQKNKLGLLTKLTDQATSVQSVGSGSGIIKSFSILSNTYRDVSKEIFSFTPINKTKEYISAFKKDFNGVGNQILAAANQYQEEAKRAIKKNKILSTENFNFLNTKYPVKFYGVKSYSLMDRGGK